MDVKERPEIGLGSVADPEGKNCYSQIEWWARLDLNQRPRAYQARALTN